MRYLIAMLIFPIMFSCAKEQTDLEDIGQINKVLEDQQNSWSQGDIEGFMSGYWKNDSLKFFSGGKLSKGWYRTLDNYKKRYPSKSHTGQLSFKTIDISKISEDVYWVMGEYHLTREVGNVSGSFIIIFKKLDGEWKIIADSTC